MNTTTKAEREKHVAQMRANNRIEGFLPDADDLAMQQRYIDGTATTDDLMQHARTFAIAMSKQQNKP